MVAAWGTAIVLTLYLLVLILGFLSLKSPDDPIGDPYFSILESLILLVAPLMVISMIVANACAPPEARAFSLTALVFMTLTAGITSAVHAVILSVSRQLALQGLAGAPLLFSFRWPSVAYALDILAWDWFFALSMIFGALAFTGRGLNRAVRALMLTSGILSLAGLTGVPLANMDIRNVGIIGYAVLAIPAFFMMGLVFRLRPKEDGDEDVTTAQANSTTQTC